MEKQVSNHNDHFLSKNKKRRPLNFADLPKILNH